MPHPLFGVQQTDARLDGQPRLATSSLWCARASDCLITPLNEGLSVAYRGRSNAATIYASDGTSGLLAAAEPAFSCEDWDGDTIREELLLLLSTQEAVRYYDATSGRLDLPMIDLTLRLDFTELGNATTADAPYWSYTPDTISGRRIEVVGDGGGNVVARHHDGSAFRTSSVAVSTGNRCSLRAVFFADGSVQAAMVVNGGAEVTAAKSATLTPVAWPAGNTRIRLNERGNGSRGTQAFRYGALYGGALSRRVLLERL